MKKLFTILALTTFAFVSNAQKTTKTTNTVVETVEMSDYKPTKGTVTTEVGLTGGLGNSGFNLNNSTSVPVNGVGKPTLKFRYFYKDNIAFRLGFSSVRSAFNTDPSTTVTTSPVPTPVPAFTPNGTTYNSTNFFGINIGAEKHFKGSDRLSTFVGADLLIGTRSTLSEIVNNTTATTSSKVTDKNATGASFFGLGLFTGADYYIAKKVYLGVELGITFLRSSNKDNVVTNENTNGSTVTTVETTSAAGGSNFDIATALNGGVRIGYQF